MTRGDLVEFLTPLSNAEMRCDCACGKWCHGHALIDAFILYLRDEFAAEATSLKLDAMSVSCVMEGFDDDDDEDIVGAAADAEVLPAPKFIDKIEAINETIRSGAVNIHDERPQWLPSWVTLIAMIRALYFPCSGKCLLERLALPESSFVKGGHVALQ